MFAKLFKCTMSKRGLAVKFVRVRVLFDVDIYKGYSNSQPLV